MEKNNWIKINIHPQFFVKKKKKNHRQQKETNFQKKKDTVKEKENKV